MFPKYDIIVVGAGHAGCEAAVVAANLGSSVLLITMNMQTIGQMSCNPAMGGIGKGQIVREIDAMGGYSGIVTDETMLQFRMLNRSKGVAVWSPRSQNDKVLFSLKWRSMLEQTKGLDFFQDKVLSLFIKQGRVCGVKTTLGNLIESKSVILTNGTFLNGLIHIGQQQQIGGRIGEEKSTGITEQLVSLGFESKRLKTGTPPRIDGRSINYTKMEEQKGDEEIVGFSYTNTKKIAASKQLSCHITYTNTEVHRALEEGLKNSPMFDGTIEGTGPRYCPSIEDKINRFSERDRHQLFVEPEGLNTVEVYLNGFSTSLSQEVQIKALRKIQGLEECKIFRPGYAIEYDYFPPTQLHYSLETRHVKGLFFAGQINGTTGYEEAACQGMMAGINACRLVSNKAPLILRRNEAYIGVLIDDLITKGTNEPYRMFTSRAEFRTLLRQDNADFRLTDIAYEIGTIAETRKHNVDVKKESVKEAIRCLQSSAVNIDEVNQFLSSIGSALLTERIRYAQLLLRPEVNTQNLKAGVNDFKKIASQYREEVLHQSEIQIKYQTYIDRENHNAEKMKKLETLNIPSNFNYQKIIALGSEAKEKLSYIKPTTLGQASRISGIKPTDVSILAVYLGR